jgi:hypothetical protein
MRGAGLGAFQSRFADWKPIRFADRGDNNTLVPLGQHRFARPGDLRRMRESTGTSVVCPARLYSEFFCFSAGIFSAALPRLTLRMISAADSVQMNGCGSALLCLMQSSIALTSSETLLKAPRRIRWVVIFPNQRSTRLSHEDEVGMK